METVANLLRQSIPQTTRPHSDVFLVSSPAIPSPKKSDVCPLCAGRGFLAFDVPAGHELFGQVKPCRCTLERKRGELFTGALEHMTLDSFKPLTDDERIAHKAAQGIARAWARGGRASLVLYAGLQDERRAFGGRTLHVTGCGCGKTHLAVGLAKLALDVGHDVKFTTETDLLRAIKNSYGDDDAPNESAILRELGRPWLLVLDDVGTTEIKSRGWYQDILYAIVNQRYSVGVPIVMTANLVPSQLSERIGPRTWSRLTSMAECLRLDGPDRREMR